MCVSRKSSPPSRWAFRMMGRAALVLVLLVRSVWYGSALRVAAPPRTGSPTRLSKGAFPEERFDRVPRQSLRGLWRLRRDCEGEIVDDVVLTLKAAGTFSAVFSPQVAADDATAARGAKFAAALRGRWYCDTANREVRLARFERQSPVEWYTGMPVDSDATLSAFEGHVTYGASEPEWIGRFEMWPMWPATHGFLPVPPLEAPRFDAGAAGAFTRPTTVYIYISQVPFLTKYLGLEFSTVSDSDVR